MADIKAKDFETILNIALALQRLQAPELAQKKAQADREALLQRLAITQQGLSQRQKPQVTGLSEIGKIASRASGRRAELLKDIDPGDTEAIAIAESQAALENRPEAQLLQILAASLLQSGDPSAAALAGRVTDVINPPSPRELKNRNLQARARAGMKREARVGGFSVKGGPRSGFSARGTPAEILAQLIETRPAELQAKFGKFTDVPQGLPPVFGGGGRFRGAGGGADFGPSDVPFPALPPEAGTGGQEPDLLMQLLEALTGAGTGTAGIQLGA